MTWAVKRRQRLSHPYYERRATFVFGVVCILACIALAVLIQRPTAFQYTVFRIILALAVACIAVFISGLIEVQFKRWLRASGAIALFIIVYFFPPVRLMPEPGNAATRSEDLSTTNAPLSNGQNGPQILHASGTLPPLADSSVFENSRMPTSQEIPKARERLTALQARAAVMVDRWEPIRERLKRADQPLRSDIDEALRMLKSYISASEGDLKQGDATAAKRNMDLVEKQLGYLGRQNPE